MLTQNIDPYNIYGPCFAELNSTEPKLTQKSTLKKAAKKFSKRPPKHKYGVDCGYDHGIENYFSLNWHIWNSDVEKFSACSDKVFNTYHMTVEGSIQAYKFLINTRKYKIILYNGDWDDVVPYTDTLKNFNKMGLSPQGTFTPWIVNNQHAGFFREYQGL